MKKKIDIIDNILFIVAMITLIPLCILDYTNDFTALLGIAEIIYKIVAVIGLIILAIHWVFKIIEIIKMIIDKVNAKRQRKRVGKDEKTFNSDFGGCFNIFRTYIIRL